MAKFELKSDLSVSFQVRLAQLLAKQAALGATGLTAEETAFLTARKPYQKNRVITWDTRDILSAQQPNPTDNPQILEAEGESLPTGYPNFKQWAIFLLLGHAGRNSFTNV